MVAGEKDFQQEVIDRLARIAAEAARHKIHANPKRVRLETIRVLW